VLPYPPERSVPVRSERTAESAGRIPEAIAAMADRDREQHHAGVGAHQLPAGERREADEESAGPGRTKQPDHQAEARQHELLDEHLSRDATPARAEC